MQFHWTLIDDGRRPWVGVAVAVGVVLAILAAVIGLMMLPALLLRTDLSRAEIQVSIRGHLASQAARRFQGGAQSDDGRARYEAEIESINALKFTGIDADTVFFSAFKARRSHVVKVEMQGADGSRNTRYFCFTGNHLTGECAKWNWYLAW